MKDRKDKPEKSAEVARKSRKRNAAPVRSPQRRPVRNEPPPAVWQGDAPEADEAKVLSESPDVVELPEPTAQSPEPQGFAAGDSSHFVVNLDHDNDPPNQQPSVEDSIEKGSLYRDLSSLTPESLFEYSAEKEVEAAMLEAELAVQTDESAFALEEAMAQEDVSSIWAEGEYEIY